MTITNMQMKGFLRQLYQMSDGDTTTDVSMYDIGAVLGLDKTEAGALAEDLIIDGYAELKTLAGGISITVEGLQALDIRIPSAAADGNSAGQILLLGDAQMLEPEALKAVEQLLDDMKKAVGGAALDYQKMEEMVIDIKTIETQLLSNRPKTAIVREILRSLSYILQDETATVQLSQTIKRMIGD